MYKSQIINQYIQMTDIWAKTHILIFGHVIDFGPESGQISIFLNETNFIWKVNLALHILCEL